jgi:hypothetical protein
MRRIGKRKMKGTARLQEHKAQEGRETEIGNPQETAAKEDY